MTASVSSVTIKNSDDLNYSSKVQQEQQEQNSLFDNLDNWVDKHTQNSEDYINDIDKTDELSASVASLKDRASALKDETKKQELLDKIAAFEEDLNARIQADEEEYSLQQEQIGTTFDFMEGNDAKDADSYNAQLTKLAQGEFDSHNVEADDVITRDEYILSELKDAKFNTVEEEKEAVAYAYALFDIIDTKLGNSDSNGSLSVKEFESFYKNLDRYHGLSSDGQLLMDDENELDGIIDIAADDFAVDIVDNLVTNFDDLKNSELIEAYHKTIFS